MEDPNTIAALRAERDDLRLRLAAAEDALCAIGSGSAEALRESEERYRLISEYTGDVIWLLDLHTGRFLYVSPSVERLRGYTPDEVRQQTMADAITPESFAQIEALMPIRIAALLAGDEEMRVQTHEIDQPTKDGSIVPTEVVTTLLQDKRGNVTRILGVSRNISERRHAEHALREKDELLREMSHIARIGGWELTVATLQATWTDEVAHIFNLAPNQQLEVTDGLNFFQGESRQQVVAAIQAALERDERYDLELEISVQGGDHKWVRAMGYPIMKDGVIVKVRGTLQDITERKQAEMELQAERASLSRRVAERTADLRRANAELAQAVRAKDEFLATMSHELRTPLNAILGLAEGLRDTVYGALTERQMKAVSTIDQSGRHLLELINDILDLSKIESGTLDIHWERVSVFEVCQSSLNFVKESALKKRIQLDLRLSDPTVAIQADPRRLKQILVNLLSNAVKFTPNEGAVTLEVVLDLEAEMICIAVQDTGIGISVNNMERLFIPFTQLDASLSRQYEGTGLGLALVRRLVDLHGGSVIVESSGVDKGSRFTICLPLYGVAQTAKPTLLPQEPLPTTVSARPLATILYVEDNEMNIETISEYLEAKGYHVEIARDGEEAIQCAQETLPALILMDIQLPVLDGLMATRRLRTDARFADTPIIALTALAMPGDRERCLAAGANEYVTKPVSLKGLLAMVEALLGP